MIITISTTILAILGIYGFFANNFILLYLGMFANIFENIIQVSSKRQKNLFALLLSIFIGFFLGALNHNVWNMIALCICIESIVMLLFSIITIYLIYKLSMKSVEKYFYTNNCSEMIELIKKWNNIPASNAIKERIIDVNAFDTLQTYTAKIVFLFNLILDISDELNYIDQLDIQVKLINASFTAQIDGYINIVKNKLKKAKEIISSLENEPYFNDYYEQSKKILHFFYEKQNILYEMNYKLKNILKLNLTVNNVPSFLQKEIAQLLEINNSLANELTNMQNIINNNDTSFNYLKLLDSERYNNAKVNTNI